MSPAISRRDEYAALSVDACLAAALLAVPRVLEKESISSDLLTALFDHLWQWPTIDEYTFREWDDWSNPALEWALGGDVPEELEHAVRGTSLSLGDLQTLVTYTVEIVHGNLYAAVQHDQTLRHLEQVERIANRTGVRLPPAALFAGEPGADPSLGHGWGGPMTGADVYRWQEAIWSGSEGCEPC